MSVLPMTGELVPLADAEIDRQADAL